jgi:hypothetical protein
MHTMPMFGIDRSTEPQFLTRTGVTSQVPKSSPATVNGALKMTYTASGTLPAYPKATTCALAGSRWASIDFRRGQRFGGGR